MNEYCVIDLNSPKPIVAAAIHDGHKLSENLAKLTALSEKESCGKKIPIRESGQIFLRITLSGKDPVLNLISIVLLRRPSISCLLMHGD